MTKRKVSTRTRFEIFKRDGFRCLYCGATPLEKPLHCDHVVALVNGGTNSPANLVTACGDCNLGKAAVPLERKRLEAKIATQADGDHAQQILEYLAIQRNVEAARTQASEVIAGRWEELIGPLTQDMFDRFDKILKDWPLSKIDEAMHITARKMGCPGEAFNGGTASHQARYFQAILRNWRNGVIY